MQSQTRIDTACSTEQTVLGEGLRWDQRRGELLHVDILGGHIHRDRIGRRGVLEPVARYGLPTTVGAVAPVGGEEGWVVAVGVGLAHLCPDGTYTPLVELVPPGHRVNDAVCDPQGRLWVGTLATDHRAGAGAVYRLDRTGGVALVLSDMTIPNGMGWSPDGNTMYVIDSGPREIRAHGFDPLTGTIDDSRQLVRLSAEAGTPDGMSVDSGGDLWVAIYGGGCVHRYDPEGKLRQVLTVPARQVTSCGFGGRGMHRLFATTATEGWSDDDRRDDPGAGLVYYVDTDATGVAAAMFRPEGAWWHARCGGDAP